MVQFVSGYLFLEKKGLSVVELLSNQFHPGMWLISFLPQDYYGIITEMSWQL